MFSRKLAIVFFILLGLISLPQKSETAQNKKRIYILFQGAYSMAQKLGSADEYVAGENDFPITPAHDEVGLGLGVIMNLSNRFAVQISVDYLLGAEVKKEDPSDGETCTYKTYDNVNLLGSGIVKLGGKTQFFISPGVGINLLAPYADKEKTGSLGSIIVIEAPDKKIHPMMVLSGGVIHNMRKTFIKLEILYARIFDYQKNSILFRLGLGF